MPYGIRYFAALAVLVDVIACSRAPATSGAAAPGVSASSAAPEGSAPAPAPTSAAPANASSTSAPRPATTVEPVGQPSTTGSAQATHTPVSGCLPYGETIVLRGIVARPAPPPTPPVSKPKGKTAAPPSKPAWRFQLEPPRCVVAAPKGKQPAEVSVSTLLLMPIGAVSDSYRTFEGRLVDATGVLVGIFSGDQVHVLYVVRELKPVAAANTE